MDFSPITQAVDVGDVVAALVAMGAIMIVPNVARWSIRKITSFFR